MVKCAGLAVPSANIAKYNIAIPVRYRYSNTRRAPVGPYIGIGIGFGFGFGFSFGFRFGFGFGFGVGFGFGFGFGLGFGIVVGIDVDILSKHWVTISAISKFC